jgi:alpha-methylacyl-CoA racemase
MVLTGIRVLDLSLLLPGGYCTQRLRSLGAEVLKIEPPDGDPLRRLKDGEVYFRALHEGKELIALDLKRAAGKERLTQLIAGADVLVEGFRPGVMERLGFGFARIRAINPRIVYCAITGYGSTGSRALRAGHDLNYLARSGALSLMPRAQGLPMIPGVQIADHAGGLDAAFLIMAALVARARTGEGSRVEVSMTALMRSWTALPEAAGRAGTSGLPLTGELPCYRVYAVADGFLSVAALEPRFWQNFCRSIDCEDLIARQFDPSAVRTVQQHLLGRTRAAWMTAFGDQDVCVEPCLALGEEPS